MNLNLFLIILSCFNSNIYSISKIIQFKFEKYNTNIANINSLKYHSSNNPNDFLDLSKNDFMFRLLTDNLYFNLTIASPPQIMPIIWNMNQYSFKIYSSSYNFNISQTFQNISEPFIYSFDEINNAILCKDIFYYYDENDNIIFNLFKFINIKEDKKNYSFVGLQLPNVVSDNILTFTKELKENEIINKYIFYIIYQQNEKGIDNPKGRLYFGDYPHYTRLFSNKYKVGNYFEVKAAKRNKIAYWDILFDNIYFSEKIKNNTYVKYKQAELIGNMQLSIGTDEYHDFILNNFFNKYIKDNICEQKIILNITDYIYYKCQKYSYFDITKFPSLFFELKEYNFNFSLDYTDLFFTHGDYIYFAIVFDKYFKLKFSHRWKLGSTLFKKYLLVFNEDSKTIGFYNNVINKKIIEPFNNNIKQKNTYSFNFIKVFAIFLLSIFIILFYRCIRKKIEKLYRKHNSEGLNYKKAKVAHNLKNKEEVHNYYELKDNFL